MIKVDVEPYCQECPCFEVVADGPEKTVFASDPKDGVSKVIEMNNTVIQCKNRMRCRNIFDYICRQMRF